MANASFLCFMQYTRLEALMSHYAAANYLYSPLETKLGGLFTSVTKYFSGEHV